jgi:hypothetical protein
LSVKRWAFYCIRFLKIKKLIKLLFFQINSWKVMILFFEVSLFSDFDFIFQA